MMQMYLVVKIKLILRCEIVVKLRLHSASRTSLAHIIILSVLLYDFFTEGIKLKLRNFEWLTLLRLEDRMLGRRKIEFEDINFRARLFSCNFLCLILVYCAGVFVPRLLKFNCAYFETKCFLFNRTRRCFDDFCGSYRIPVLKGFLHLLCHAIRLGCLLRLITSFSLIELRFVSSIRDTDDWLKKVLSIPVLLVKEHVHSGATVRLTAVLLVHVKAPTLGRVDQLALIYHCTIRLAPHLHEVSKLFFILSDDRFYNFKGENN